jgi:hypothetical protein
MSQQHRTEALALGPQLKVVKISPSHVQLVPFPAVDRNAHNRSFHLRSHELLCLPDLQRQVDDHQKPHRRSEKFTDRTEVLNRQRRGVLLRTLIISEPTSSRPPATYIA